MRHSTPAFLLAPALLCSTALAAPRPDEAVDIDLVRRLAALETRFARHAAPDAGWLDEQRHAEIRTLILDVLADADMRTALQDDDLTAGHDGDFFITSADGRFTMSLGGHLMLRYVLNRRQDQPDPDDETIDGFEVRRAKLELSGTVAEPELDWRMSLAFDTETGAGELQSFSIERELTDDVSIGIARARPPLLKEESVSSKRQLAAERSLVAKTFNQGRRVGATLQARWDPVRVRAGVFDQTENQLDDGSVTISARAEWLLSGRFRALRDFSSFPDDDELTVALGAGARYAHVDEDDVDEDGDLWRWTADLTVERGGANLMGAIVLSHDKPDEGPSRDQIAALLQGGFFAGPDWELFARYEWGDADGEAPDLSIITIGATRFFDGHDRKFTVDVGYGLNEVASFWSNDGAGWLTDEDGGDGQVVARAQFQLLW